MREKKKKNRYHKNGSNNKYLEAGFELRLPVRSGQFVEPVIHAVIPGFGVPETC